MRKESLGLSLAKLILTVSFIIVGGAWLGTVAYSLAHPEFAVNFGRIINPTSAVKAINKIEISADAKLILNAETKEVLFTIDDTNKYLKNSGYAYQPKADLPRADDPDTFQDTNTKYAGDCFFNAALSNNKDRIVFSTGCLPGDLQQAWVGVYKIQNPYKCPPGRLCEMIPASFQFLIGGSGRNFVWSADDKTITYEADFRLEFTETRTVDSATGEILKSKNKSTINDSEIKDWKIYTNNRYGFTFKYPGNWKVIGNIEGNESADANASTVSVWDPQTKILAPIIYKDSENDIDTVIAREKSGLKNSIQKSTIIGGVSAVKISGVISEGNMGEGESRDLYILDKNGTILRINVDLGNSRPILVNQILSTFKFIDLITVNMRAQNESGESGTATLTDAGNGRVKVLINLDNVPGGGQPAYIQTGICANPGQIKYLLTDVTNGLVTNLARGKSETIINISLADLHSQLPLIITVRQSTVLQQYYFSCGNMEF